MKSMPSVILFTLLGVKVGLALSAGLLVMADLMLVLVALAAVLADVGVVRDVTENMGTHSHHHYN
jgi:hypothetical protein